MKLSPDDIEFILECIGERAKKEKDNIDYSHYEEYKKFADRYSNILIELEEEKDRIEKRKKRF